MWHSQGQLKLTEKIKETFHVEDLHLVVKSLKIELYLGLAPEKVLEVNYNIFPEF